MVSVDQLNPLLRVSVCHVMSVPAVVIASVADRVSVKHAPGVSTRCSACVSAIFDARLLISKFDIYGFTSITIKFHINALHHLCYQRAIIIDGD